MINMPMVLKNTDSYRIPIKKALLKSWFFEMAEMLATNNYLNLWDLQEI